jgi:hypothetical protein
MTAIGIMDIRSAIKYQKLRPRSCIAAKIITLIAISQYTIPTLLYLNGLLIIFMIKE